MSTLNPIHAESNIPSDQEAQVARQSGQVLASWMKSDREVRLRVQAEGDPYAEIALPPSAVRLLLGALEEIGKGNSVTLLHTDTELTSQQAADLVRVSHPFFIQLLDEGKIPYRMVGAHRRVLYQDVAHYMQEEEVRRVKVMEELVAETEELGQGSTIDECELPQPQLKIVNKDGVFVLEGLNVKVDNWDTIVQEGREARLKYLEDVDSRF